MKKHVLEVYLSMRHKKGSNCVVRFGSNFDSVISLWKKRENKTKRKDNPDMAHMYFYLRIICQTGLPQFITKKW